MEVDNLLTSLRGLNDHINNLKLPWESNCHWEARKKFLFQNWNSYENKDRLISLSCAWSNVHFLGNCYPGKVMHELREMEKGLENLKDFVNYTDTKSKLNQLSCASTTKEHINSHKLPNGFMPLNFVKSSDNQLVNSIHKVDEQKGKNNLLQKNYNTKDSKIVSVSSNCIITKPSKTFESLANNDSNKTAFSDNGCEKCPEMNTELLTVLSKFSIKLGKYHLSKTPNLVTVFFNIAQQTCVKITVLYGSIKKEEFSLFKNWADCCQSTISVACSAWVCDIYLEEAFVSQSCGTSKSSAKASAVAEAVKILTGSYSVTNVKRRLNSFKYVIQVGVQSQPSLHESPPLVTLQGAPILKVMEGELNKSQVCTAQTPSACQTNSEKFNLQPIPFGQMIATRKMRYLPSCEKDNSTSNRKVNLDNFVVVLIQEQQNPVGTLANSASMSKFNLDFVKRQSLPGEIEFVVLLNNVEIASAFSETVIQAKISAAENALSFLESRCPVLLKIKQVGNLNEALTLDDKEINNGSLHSDPVMPENNVGNKLLRKMGWSGSGGLGKKEDGILEPVRAAYPVAQRFRTGLGHEAPSHVKFENAERAIREYVRNGCENELTFSPELSNNERRVIHSLARKHGLKSKSFGTIDRHLVIYKPLSVQDIARNLHRAGGELNGYKLVKYP